jgi:hypothetical protein
MDATTRRTLEASGWKLGDAADFLGMSEEERQLLDARGTGDGGSMPARGGSTFAESTRGDPSNEPAACGEDRACRVRRSMDQLIRAFTALGGRIVVKTTKSTAGKGQKSRTKRKTFVLQVQTSESP